MLTISVHTLDLKGTSYEIGYKLGNIISENTAHKILTLVNSKALV